MNTTGIIHIHTKDLGEIMKMMELYKTEPEPEPEPEHETFGFTK